MVKLIGPLFSLNASGAVGKDLTYSNRKSGGQVRKQKKQAYANTAAQQPVQTYFDEGRTAWGTLSDADKTAWDTFNKG